MSKIKSFLQDCIDTVASMEVHNESEAIAKEVVLSSAEENIKLEQALIDIREYVEKYKHLNWYIESCHFNDILQIINKALGDDE